MLTANFLNSLLVELELSPGSTALICGLSVPTLLIAASALPSLVLLRQKNCDSPAFAEINIYISTPLGAKFEVNEFRLALEAELENQLLEFLQKTGSFDFRDISRMFLGRVNINPFIELSAIGIQIKDDIPCAHLIIYNDGPNNASTGNSELRDDKWIDMVHALSRDSAASLNESQSIAIFCTNRVPLQREGQVKALGPNSPIPCVILSPHLALILRENIERWESLEHEHGLSHVLSEIERLELPYLSKALIQARILSHFDRDSDAQVLLEPFLDEIKNDDDSELLIMVLPHLMASKRNNDVREVLAKLINTKLGTGQKFLVFKFANFIEAHIEEKLISEQLQENPENFDVLIESLLPLYTNHGDYGGLVSVLEVFRATHNANPDWRFYYTLSTSLNSQENVKYDDLLKLISKEHRINLDHAIFLCLAHALQGGRFTEAGRLVHDHCSDCFLSSETENRIHLFLALARKLVIHSSAEPEPKEVPSSDNSQTEKTAYQKQNPTTHTQAQEYLSSVLILLIRQLRHDPQNVRLRNSLVLFFRYDLSHSESTAHFLLYISKNAIFDIDKISKKDRLYFSELDDITDDETIYDILNKLTEQLDSKFTILGMGRLSLSGLNKNPYSVLRAIIRRLEYAAGNRIDSDEEVRAIYMILHISIILSRCLGDEESEMRVFSTAAGGLANAGRHQTARDLAENALSLLKYEPNSDAEDHTRLRITWTQYAKIMHRVKDFPEAMIAACCALSTNTKITTSTFIDEKFLLGRMLRDLNMLEMALFQIESISEFLDGNENNPMSSHHIFREIVNIKLRMFTSEERVVDNEIRKFIEEILTACVFARENTFDIFPLCIALAQLDRIFIAGSPEEIDQSLSARIQAELTASGELMGEPNVSRLKMYHSMKPSMASLESLCKQLEQTRYAEDLSYDMIQIEQLAKSMLTNQIYHDCYEALYLIDLLTDHSVQIPEKDSIDFHSANKFLFRQLDKGVTSEERTAFFAQYERLRNKTHSERIIVSPDDLSALARKVMDTEVGILGLAIKSDKQLFSIFLTKTISDIHHEKFDVFDKTKFLNWSKIYPFTYHDMDTRNPNGYFMMLQTLSGLAIDIDIPVGVPIIIILDRLLQRIPPNLLRIRDELLGFRNPVGLVPSLAWLRSNLENSQQRSGKRVGWVPLEDSYEALSTLRTLHDAIFPILADFSFTTIANPDIGDELNDCDIAVVGSHGQLGDGGQLFRAVADEGFGRISAREFSFKLARCGIVVLFICSGGRIDPHPLTTMTLGLSRMLISAGCRVVVASPWPLDITIPTKWLSPFLEALQLGKNVSEACFQANNEVRKFVGHPAAYLAMNVYGDPLYKLLAHD